MSYKELLAKWLDPFKFKLRFGSSKLNLFKIERVTTHEGLQPPCLKLVSLRCRVVWNTSYIGPKYTRRSQPLLELKKKKVCIKQYLFFILWPLFFKKLFNTSHVFMHCFAYLLTRLSVPYVFCFFLVGLGGIFLIIRVVYRSLRMQLFRKDFHTGISS